MYNDKNVLFIAPKFFGYESEIIEGFVKLGFTVDYYDERSIEKTYQKALLKINPHIFYFKSKKYYENILLKAQTKKYDYIIFIKCEMIPLNTLRLFRNVFPNTTMNLYLWDSLRNIKGIRKKLSVFNNILSFDRLDCLIEKSIKHRSLFYLDKYKNNSFNIESYRYDITFIGTVHSDRFKIIQSICTKYNNYHFFKYMFLQSKFIYIFYKIIKKEFRKSSIDIFVFNKLTSNEISNIVLSSNVILDIQHPKQSGLTMRTIEMLGMQKKIITTNKDIENYDFYRKENILIIDRHNIIIPEDFVKSKYIPINTDIYESYSLNSWILDLLVK